MRYCHVWHLKDSMGNRSTLTVRENEDQSLRYSLATESGIPECVGNMTRRGGPIRPRMMGGRDSLTLTQEVRHWIDSQGSRRVEDEEGQATR